MKTLDLSMKLNLAVLRKECPRWTWTAERYGFGWTYRGVRSERSVRVYAVSRLCGPGEDDYTTDWQVDDGKVSESYAVWMMLDEGRDAA